MRFTKDQRREIVRDFAIRHNGQYDPKLFLEEVRAHGSDHPAYEWFEWDNSRAAKEYRLWQAREFARDLRVTFSVDEIGGKRDFKITQIEVPLVHSPMDGRDDGGGYLLTDVADQAHMAELCRQGASSLASWLRRYQGAVEYAGGSTKQIERTLKALEAVAEPHDEAA